MLMIEELKEKYRVAKENLLRSRYIYNYFIIPSFIAFVVLDFIAIAILLAIDSIGLIAWSVSLFLLAIVGLVVLLCFLPYVKKQELKNEILRMEEFFKQELLEDPTCEYVMPRSDTGGIVELVFSPTGMSIGGQVYSYDGFECGMFTSNYMNRANLVVVFSRTEVGDEEDADNEGVLEFSLPLDINLLSILKKYNIKLVNEDVFNFVKEHTEIAVKQIIKYGKIQNNYYKVK